MSSTETRVVAGRYRLLERLGDGSTATTYLAADELLARRVAVKLFRPEYLSDPRDRARFEREARAAAAVSHPNVVQVFDVGQDGATRYLVMEWVDGTDLKRVIRERAPLPAEEAVAIARDLLAGLAAIHRAGIVHRDVKPQNVLLDRAGRAKIADFGIARIVRDTGLTETGSVIGTAAYMAPEQATGRPVSPATDLYAVGVILYELLTGRLPFPGENPLEVLYQHVHESPVPPRRRNPAIPSSLEAVVLRALAKAPQERFRSAEAMAAALDAAVVSPSRGSPGVGSGMVAAGRGLGRTQRVAGRASMRRAGRQSVLVAGGVAVLVTVVVLALALASERGADREPATATTTPVPTPVTQGAAPAVVPEPSPTPEPAPTATPLPTATPVPTPVPTATPRPEPTVTPAPSLPREVQVVSPPEARRLLPPGSRSNSFDFDPADIEGAYLPERDGADDFPKDLRDAALLLPQPSGYDVGTVTVEVDRAGAPLVIEVEGRSGGDVAIQLLVNGTVLWEGVAPFPDRRWERLAFVVPAVPPGVDEALTVSFRIAERGGTLGEPSWFAIRSLDLTVPDSQ